MASVVSYLHNSYPQEMSPRARIYLMATFVSHSAMAILCLVFTHTFRSVSYTAIRSVMPLEMWGVGFGLVAVLALFAAVRKHEWFAYFSLVLSVITTFAWAGGFVAGAVTGEAAGFTGPIAWSILAIKDVLMCSQPMRTPFEPVARRVLGEDDPSRERHRDK